MYLYQVQIQMHVSCLYWCDFCVWSPVGAFCPEDQVWQSIYGYSTYQSTEFLFQQTFASDYTLHDHFSLRYSSLSQNSPTKEIPMHRQVLPKLKPSTKCNTPNLSYIGLVCIILNKLWSMVLRCLWEHTYTDYGDYNCIQSDTLVCHACNAQTDQLIQKSQMLSSDQSDTTDTILQIVTESLNKVT